MFGAATSDADVGATSEDQDKISSVSCSDNADGYNDTDFTDGVSSALLTTCTVNVYEPGSVTITLTSQNSEALVDSASNGANIAYGVTVAGSSFGAGFNTSDDLADAHTGSATITNAAITDTITITGNTISAISDQVNGTYQDDLTLTVTDQR